ncbi:hypothetical protein [Streptomyces klenkii]|uniref:hypothetical protein n=1 Tax=Streptomyces klenkii TaxID=1420899 RepID=UPI003436FE44
MTIKIDTCGFRATEGEHNQQLPASAVAPTEDEDQHDAVVISSAEFDWIQAAAELFVFAERRGLRLLRADGPNGHLLSQGLVLDNLLLFPPDRHPRDVLRDVDAGSGAGHSPRSADGAP